jgi:hypothetical protein
MGLWEAREKAEALLRQEAAEQGTEVTAMGEPVAAGGGVAVNAQTADGGTAEAWAADGADGWTVSVEKPKGR